MQPNTKKKKKKKTHASFSLKSFLLSENIFPTIKNILQRNKRSLTNQNSPFYKACFEKRFSLLKKQTLHFIRLILD
jgi:hypothetical protein